MKNITCKIIGHKLAPIKKATVLNKEYECSSCKQKFTTDGYGQIVKLNSYWEANNLLFKRVFEQKQARAL